MSNHPANSGIPAAARGHPFVRTPNTTLIGMTLPVLFALIAEPLTGLVDTAFVARIGEVPLAALGVGTTALSALFWIFNFLEIGTQTEVANALGRDHYDRARQVSSVALLLALLLGIALTLITALAAPLIARAMGATGAVHEFASIYIRVRAFGAPAILIVLSAFGILRGLQQMHAPLWIALGLNALNLVLDAALIFGLGPLPALGVAGAALASVLAQWCGAAIALLLVARGLGIARQLSFADARALLHVGGDLFVRTGLLTGFMVLTTRAATQIGSDAGAAHQVIRQLWILSALFLDAFAVTGQSLVGYFSGARWLAQARRVAVYVCAWSLATGVFLSVAMLLAQPLVIDLVVPPGARPVFAATWFVAALVQPLNSLTFATDGIHWGTGDFRYLRNVMLIATGIGATSILLIDVTMPGALVRVWIITGLWSSIRAAFGVLRVWPGIGAAPLANRPLVQPASGL